MGTGSPKSIVRSWRFYFLACGEAETSAERLAAERKPESSEPEKKGPSFSLQGHAPMVHGLSLAQLPFPSLSVRPPNYDLCRGLAHS